jgi:hypothetical protein
MKSARESDDDPRTREGFSRLSEAAMGDQKDDGLLVVRRHERHACRVPVRLSVSPAHADRVAFSSAVGPAGDGEGGVRAELVDVSDGGLGIETTVMLPRSCHAVVRVSVEGGQTVEATVRVQRVLMTDLKPVYYLGTSLVDDGDEAKRLMGLIVGAARTEGGTQRAGA